jgi:xanthine dehydrogenase small subunit
MVELNDAGSVEAARLAYGGMAATSRRAAAVEAALLGRPWTLETVEAAAAHLTTDFTPIDDHRCSSWYRATVAKNFLLGFWAESTSPGCKPLPDRPVGTVLLEGAV